MTSAIYAILNINLIYLQSGKPMPEFYHLQVVFQSACIPVAEAGTARSQEVPTAYQDVH